MEDITNKVWSSPLDQADEFCASLPSGSPSLTPRFLGIAGRTAAKQATRSHYRVVYAGETVNHSGLSPMTGHGRFHSERPPASKLPTVYQSRSYPSSSLPSPSWIERSIVSDEDGIGPFSDLPPEEEFYLRSMKKVLFFPPNGIMNTYMMAFLDHVLPEFPVVDRFKLASIYDSFLGGVALSPLLFHAILFCASQYVDNDTLKQTGFDTRMSAKEYFYRRAAMLYFLDCEQDQLLVIQAVIFISPWWSDYNEDKDTRYWISCACNLAQAMGMHATMSKWTQISPDERSLWRRILWTLFSREHNVAIGVGTPFLLRRDDINVEPLTVNDFYEFLDSTPVESAGGSPPGVIDFTAFSRVHVSFALELVRLSVMMDQLVKMDSPSLQHQTNALEFYAEFQNRLTRESPPVLVNLCANVPGLRESTRDNDTDVEEMWLTFLRINYERILALNARYLYKAILSATSSPPGVPSEEQARMLIVRSASRTLNMFEDLLAMGFLKYSHGFMNTAIINSMITMAEEIKLAPEDSQRYKTAENKFALGMMILEEMRKYWPPPLWAYSLFSHLSQDHFSRLKQLLPQRPSSSSPPPLSSSSNADRRDIDTARDKAAPCEPCWPGQTIDNFWWDDLFSLESRGQQQQQQDAALWLQCDFAELRNSLG
ncbi:hypothetical protein AYO21_07198 [Fonsecaea monophora]|uniref:Xylanolytic transcriptional activator regulatory domain-containing protein n=1 Tax=Fonsecaea monophora TaxID=254056 RepID=A0A177F2R7_9EURO|nr:hypothetical protein AYO21_07198 [Fonsecaea monophora]OAG38538.1 hypothetical protein AYO21_07198 [Fonsecaea monophora]